MATTEKSGNSTTADSYIGSLISLTSKSEIRYEGLLYNINTDESSIGLKNVRSFGTEGRKKDGPQIPQSDKVYEYILFRGSDIKDLQVKSSPLAHPTPPINNDPAIIQSHYPQQVSTSPSLPSTVGGSLSDIGSHNAQMGVPGSNFQGGLPLYQPGGTLGTWGAAPPPPSANGGGLAMPMYWQGYYGPHNGLPHIHQQSLLRPPPGLSMPPPMQQSIQYPNLNATLPITGSNLPGSNMLASNSSSSFAEVSSLSLPASSSPLNLVPTSSLPSTLPSLLPPMPSTTLASETLPSLIPNKAPSSVPSVANLTTSLPSLSSLTASSLELNTIVPPIPTKPSAISGPLIPYQSVSQSTSSAVVSSSSLHRGTPAPLLLTPGQLLQSGPTRVSSPQPVQTIHKDVEVVQVSSSLSAGPTIPVGNEAQLPILPLPVPSRASHKPNGALFHTHTGYRGRERGRGIGSSVTTFTEEFDFEAMNEKFKKDEVWGHLGKGSKSHPKDEEDGTVGDGDDSQDEVDDDDDNLAVKPVYNKDDFFDTLSCNTLGHDSQNGRTRFYEQMKIDTETFGEFPRYRGGRGGRGTPRGGRSRGSYYGSGYGSVYGGRGRGRAVPYRYL